MKNNNQMSADEALRQQKAITDLVVKIIKSETKNCVRRSIMVVTSLPSGGKVGVTEGYSLEIKLPYISTLTFSLGDNVIVEWFHSLNNAIVIAKSGVI